MRFFNEKNFGENGRFTKDNSISFQMLIITGGLVLLLILLMSA